MNQREGQKNGEVEGVVCTIAVNQGEAPSIPVCGVRVCMEEGRVSALMVKSVSSYEGRFAAISLSLC